MTRPRGTPRRGGRHGSIHEAEHLRKAKVVNNGYDNSVSPLVHTLIEDRESAQVPYFDLATGNYGNQIKFYCLAKNMLGNLVEEVLANWSAATSSILNVRGLLVDMDTKFSSLNVSFARCK